MKKILLLTFFIASFSFAKSQSLERFVIASAGDFAFVGPVSISFTIGELAAVESFLTNPLMHLTQGFQQPDASYKSVPNVAAPSGSFSLFPNPAKDRVGISYSGLVDGKLRIRLFNVLGQELKSLEVFPQIGQTSHLLDLYGVSQGLYLIEISGKRAGADFRETAKLNVVN